VVEKGSEVGAHILSGAVMDPIALSELLPNWKELGAPLNQPVTSDDVLFLNESSAKRTPNFLVPDCFHNDGNYVISLGAFNAEKTAFDAAEKAFTKFRNQDSAI
jgi:electron-transferring-flavoprotein dehydrogenase